MGKTIAKPTPPVQANGHMAVDDHDKLTPKQIAAILYDYKLKNSEDTYREFEKAFLSDFWVLTIRTIVGDQWIMSVRIEHTHDIPRFKQFFEELLADYYSFAIDSTEGFGELVVGD